MLLKRKKRIDDIKNKKDFIFKFDFYFLRKIKIVIVINSVFN